MWLKINIGLNTKRWPKILDHYTKLVIIGKGNKERVNPLNSRVIDIVETWLDERGRVNGPLFVRVFKGGKVTLLPITDKTVYNIIVRRWGTGDIPAKCRTGLYSLALMRLPAGHWFSNTALFIG